MKLGFIGLGIMGKPMAKNLLNEGHDVVVFDLNKENVDELVAAGATAADSGKAVAEQAATVITMLPNSPHVDAAVLGENGVLEGAKEGHLIIDMSSIAPLESQRIAKVCKEKGVDMLDAPVSGGEPKAVDASLSIMVGGDKDLFEKVKDSILLKLGASAVYCGDNGAGNTTKLANQVVVALNIAAVSEGLMLSRKAGVDPNLVFDAIRGGLAGSTVMDAKAPMILNNDFEPGFRIDLHIKDLNNAVETGHGVGSPLLLTTQVLEMMVNLQSKGHGSDDHGGLAQFYEGLAGETISGK